MLFPEKRIKHHLDRGALEDFALTEFDDTGFRPRVNWIRISKTGRLEILLVDEIFKQSVFCQKLR